MDILPAIDLREGKCVRLLQGDYDKQINYSEDPVAVAKRFEASGAQWVHVVDLDGAREGTLRNLPTIERMLKETNLQMEVGGGLRDTRTIEELLRAGVSRCVVGTRALEDWEWFRDLVHREDCGKRIALGLDARQGQLAVKGWTEQTRETALQVAERVADWPLAAIIYTDIGRDGMLLGPNVEAIKILADLSKIPIIASGGVTDIEDVRRLSALPLLGIIIGRAIYEGQLDLSEAVRLVRTV
ncbi:MAG TPA: 1-(5-phosphoribosyl)-5-[(5-phosphoribosylamino)methylideneamino]imidazole-4-carboxamide isomerase [Phycisphaerae bacterium]|jgi:phosphoribosylformimino-5-aminoimidazole carboxamide ribotide isomerase|nr:1-(5-phosphoribosyl)-5-[(5-phosphoribosylamino)methylideneamino]imidazole-4-carboxamide isomerase [Phycisphaerae bacterium]HOB76655.1 1-(5-phosphoribosyl)-5-[(5-phosphoribosylamino)methylideneamino]imidazole-4-carboxamide isomerase [Phycisphaerae bacterium]HOJ56673.1 1-(5-phosphoribosyl)-5-[(5-phosphoribosylamino)methylideneamino]imidazole-4-carboxamide isomerase [Phycisphaerae bacterium]HOL28458.1 1-(5-phosphoribosyl)-5-[(5-phosphoribosylamino)methylideneamino]imidazole-4-carboxamide isomera